jgi:hypothetical protein
MNSSKHNIGHRVIYSVLETLLFDMHDMHRPEPYIFKVREFQKGLTIKEFLEYLQSLIIKRSFNSLCTLQTNVKWLDFFL